MADIIQAKNSEALAGFGRIPVHNVQPVLENGAYPAKAVQNGYFPVTANIFREGHDAVGAAVILTAPDGCEQRFEMHQIEPMGLDIWHAWVLVGDEGDYVFRVEAYDDRWATWRHDADIKLAIGQDIELVCAQGWALLSEAREQAAGDHQAVAVLQRMMKALDPRQPTEVLASIVKDAELYRAMVKWCPRKLLTPTPDFPLVVHRKAAQFTSWYEFFPRSIGAYRADDGSWVSGTLRSSEKMLQHIADLGFDVAYIPPIHPIGKSFRKGPNNTLDAGPNDPGSPWAIGSAEGGHDAIAPELGTLDDFDHFVATAKRLGLEIALDFALQASPDHPWASQHPEWFTKRPDGSIAYAENPPKKYQDIYPLNFDNDPEGLYAEIMRILEFWISHGVTIFRVDNPHTKPVNFWARLAADLHDRHPEVLLQAEAFTRPEMMHALAKVGFHLSYCYFTWRNTKQELAEYLDEISHDTASFFHPNFFTNTPDINPVATRSGLPAAFAIRMVLAATMSPAWGIYSGFELCEFAPLVAGGEEYLNSEKYEYRPRDFEQPGNLNDLIRKLNTIRNEHPAFQQLHTVHILQTSNEQLFAFAKHDGPDAVIVIVSLDPENIVEGSVNTEFGFLGLSSDRPVQAHDELNNENFDWKPEQYVRLSPQKPAHILRIGQADNEPHWDDHE